MKVKTWIADHYQGDVNDRHSRCWTHKSYGGTDGLQYLFPQPAHFEIFPTIFAKLNGAVSCAIGGGGGGGGGVGGGGSVVVVVKNLHTSHIQGGPGIINKRFDGQQSW